MIIAAILFRLRFKTHKFEDQNQDQDTEKGLCRPTAKLIQIT